MRLATILFVMILLLAACDKQPSASQTDETTVEVVIVDQETAEKVGTALVPRSLAFEYKYIGLYEGTAPAPDTDFDIVSVPMVEGGEVYLLCVR